MIKAQDLRINNYVSTILGNIVEVFEIREFVVRVKYKTDLDVKFSLIQYEHLQPIPLTEQWLIDFRFKKDVDGSFMKNDVSLFLDKRFKTNLYLQTNQSFRKFEWFGFENRVNYVHQLQNLITL